MSTKKEILENIRANRNKCYKRPRFGMPKKYFDQLSYHNWAVNEIIREIEKSDMPPMLVVESFISKMEDCACRNKKNSRMFSIAKDAGEWVLDILISMN